jgi:long-chain acyl-CoA synthetase
MDVWPNLGKMFFSQAEKLGGKPFLWAKQDGAYRARTWTETAETVRGLARGLRDLGVEKGDRVLLCSENRPEWPIAHLAIMAAGGITVPAYTTNTVNDHLHVLSNSEAMGAIVSTRALAEKLVPAAQRTDGVEFVISIEEYPQSHSSGPEVHLWDEVLKLGAGGGGEIDEIVDGLGPDDTAVIIYTSGTGGAPKGVMLAHKSVMHNCQGAQAVLKPLGLGEEVFLSFLPLSHSYEYTAGQFFPISIGAQIYYAEGIEHLAKNMAEAKPTIMTAVPRLYETMYGRIMRGVEKAGGAKEKLFRTALELGSKKLRGERLSLGESVRNAVVEKLVRNKVRANFGGRLKALVSGGAPLNYDIGVFFSSLGLTLLQGYGQTESAPVISCNVPGGVKLETVGPPLINTEVKIAGDGEILVRGDLVMQGYWRNEDATREAIKDGWLHTGDVGHLDEENRIVITDRKKDIIVNSGGDNISPQRVEGMLTLEPEIAQAMVIGDKRPHLVGLIVPDPDFAKEWAASNDKPNDLAQLIADSDFIKAIDTAIDRVNSGLGVIERVRKFNLTDEAFTIDNEMMTPSLKVRRHKVMEKYGEALEGLYV